MNDENGSSRSDAVPDGGAESMGLSARVTSEAERSDGEDAEPASPEPVSEAQREFLLEAVRRAPLLRALRSAPADAATLSESVDMSRSTVHRATNALQNHDIVEKSDGQYALTGLGEAVAEQTESFGTGAWTALALSQFLNSIDMNGNRIPVEHFVDATIITQQPRQPHANIHRIIKLIENSDSLRMLSTVISPVYVDVGYREMMNGMEIQAIFESEVLDIMRAQFTEQLRETTATGNFDVYAQTDIPFELFIFDDKMGMAAHTEGGNAEVLVECDDPAAMAWAEDLFVEYLSTAEPLVMDR